MIANIIGLGGFLVEFFSRIYPDNKELESAAKMADRVSQSYNVMATGSVHKSASMTVISPMVVIDNNLLHAEYINDLMQVIMLRDIVAVLGHLSLQNTVELGVKVRDVVGTISPDRGGMMALEGCEAFKGGGVTTKKDEADKQAVDEDGNVIANYVQVNGKPVLEISEYATLAVGKTVMATLYGSENRQITFPLTFRSIPMSVPPKELSLIFSAAGIERGFFARWKMVKMREITPASLLSGDDIVRAQFKIKDNEKAGYYREATRRESGNRMAAVRSGLVSLNSHANAFVISSDTAKRIEMETGKRFDNDRGREEIFKSVKANLIVVCNEDRGLFTFYSVASRIPETYNRNGLVIRSKKDSGANTLSDLVKILNGGV